MENKVKALVTRNVPEASLPAQENPLVTYLEALEARVAAAEAAADSLEDDLAALEARVEDLENAE